MKRAALPFRYPGGKYYAMDILQPYWEAVDCTEYREPFAGGATVFFHKPKAELNWLNDLDSELMECYRTMQDPFLREKMAEEFKSEIASKERWKEIYESVPENNYEIAKKYYYLNRTSFSGKLVSAAWGYRPKRSLPPERWFERIIPCGEALEGVRLTNLDFSDVIRAPGDNVLLYVDPPYYLPPKRFGNTKFIKVINILSIFNVYIHWTLNVLVMIWNSWKFVFRDDNNLERLV